MLCDVPSRCMHADDGVTPPLHPQRPQVLHQARRAHLGRRRDHLRPRGAQVRGAEDGPRSRRRRHTAGGYARGPHERVRAAPPRHHQAARGAPGALRHAAGGLQGGGERRQRLRRLLRPGRAGEAGRRHHGQPPPGPRRAVPEPHAQPGGRHGHGAHPRRRAGAGRGPGRRLRHGRGPQRRGGRRRRGHQRRPPHRAHVGHRAGRAPGHHGRHGRARQRRAHQVHRVQGGTPLPVPRRLPQRHRQGRAAQRRRRGDAPDDGDHRARRAQGELLPRRRRLHGGEDHHRDGPDEAGRGGGRGREPHRGSGGARRVRAPQDGRLG